MLRNLQNFAKLKKVQLDNLVDFEKCNETRIYLPRSVPIQPKTSQRLPKFDNIWSLPCADELPCAASAPATLIQTVQDLRHQDSKKAAVRIFLFRPLPSARFRDSF